jgi:hypothetical protein
LEKKVDKCLLVEISGLDLGVGITCMCVYIDERRDGKISEM